MSVIQHNPEGLFPPYRSYPSYDDANVQLRVKYMGSNRPASAVVVSQLLEKKWKLEVEVVAAK